MRTMNTAVVPLGRQKPSLFKSWVSAHHMAHVPGLSRGRRSSPCPRKSAPTFWGQSICEPRGSFLRGIKIFFKNPTMILIMPRCVIGSNSHRLGAMKASLWSISGEVTFSGGADERNPLLSLAFKLGHCLPIWWDVGKPRNVAADGAFLCARFVLLYLLYQLPPFTEMFYFCWDKKTKGDVQISD